IVVVPATPDRHAPIAPVQPKVKSVVSGREVGIERKEMRIDDHVTGEQQSKRVVSLERGMIGVEASSIAIDVHERVPVLDHASYDLVDEPELVGASCSQGARRYAGGVPDFPAEHLQTT